MPRNEYQTRVELIDPALHDRGWTEAHIREEKTPGGVDIINGKPHKRRGRTDYLLCLPIIPGKPPLAVAVLEAKAEDKLASLGIQQARDYAKRFNTPFVYSTNGHLFAEFADDTQRINDGRALAIFPTPDELRQRYEALKKINLTSDAALPLFMPYKGGELARWYFQDAAIRATLERIAAGLRVDNPQIINGQQTTRTLHRNLPQSAKASVVVRVIRVPRDKHEHSNGFDALVSRIVAATNWQNEIRQSDLMSNDRRQIEIDRALRKFGYCYVRKRQTKGEMRRTSGVRSHAFIRKEQLAQAVAGCDLDPLIVREGKEYLFDEEYYSQVFPTADPYYYLTRYCTFCAVTYAARGFPERGYAKWVALNFVWNRVAPLVRSKQAADCFHQSWFRSWESMRFLISSVDVVFKAALQFYRIRRGKGAKARDVSSFFKRKNLHVEFERFWQGSNNQRKGAFKRSWTRYEKKFREEVEA